MIIKLKIQELFSFWIVFKGKNKFVMVLNIKSIDFKIIGCG